MTFVRRLVQSNFTLSQGTFSESGSNQASFSNFRTSCRISKAGSVQETMLLSIWGLPLDVMNEISTLGQQIQLVPRNMVTVLAGDEGGTMTMVFQGIVQNAWINMSTPADGRLDVEATAAGHIATQSIPPSSYQGSADVPTIMQKLAGQAGLDFENNGVTTKLHDPYLHGSVFSQIEQCAQAAGISAVVDLGKLIIIPANKSRNGDVPIVSKDTGMIGYPSFTSQLLIVSCLFNPAIKYRGKIQVVSELKLGIEVWGIIAIDYQLDSLLPQGEWKQVMQCFNPAYAAPVV